MAMLLGSVRRTGLMLWVGTVCRLVLACVWLYAGLTKVGDLRGSVRAVKAYQLLPNWLAEVVGAALPMLEIVVGLLLLLGLAVRVAASASVLLLVAFLVGISSAWARGLRIDCGCFGGGGELALDQSPQYGLEIVRDAGLLVAAFLAVRPGTRLALDGALAKEGLGRS